MTVQMKKTYRGINPEMLHDEMRDIVAQHGLKAAKANQQTYSVSSGATQSRVTVPLQTSEGEECGSIHILGSANGDARMTLHLNDGLIPSDVVKALESDISFMFGSYEVRW